MDVKVKELESSKVEMTVVIPAATVEEHVERRLQQLGKGAQFKGFRKGKVPAGMLRGAYGERARADALNELLGQSYPQALEQGSLRPVDQGSIEKMEHEPGGDLTYVAVVEVEPTVEPTGYKGVELSRASRSVEDGDVEKALDQLRKQYANWTPVEEGGAAAGDQLSCDIQETDEGGAALADRLYRNIQVELGQGQYGPAFDEQMQGATPGEERKIVVENPEDDPDPDTAGKVEHYKVKVHEIKRPVLAELDDEFAKEVPPGFETLDELRGKVVEDLGRQLERSLEQDLNNRLIGKILEKNPVTVPEKMVEAQLDAIIEQARKGTQNPIDEAIVKRSYREQVTRNLQWTLVARSIVKTEALALSDEEIEAEVARYAASVGQNPKTARLQLKRMGALDRLRDELLDRKLMGFLREQAKIEVTDAPAGEPAAESAE